MKEIWYDHFPIYLFKCILFDVYVGLKRYLKKKKSISDVFI